MSAGRRPMPRSFDDRIVVRVAEVAAGVLAVAVSLMLVAGWVLVA